MHSIPNQVPLRDWNAIYRIRHYPRNTTYRIVDYRREGGCTGDTTQKIRNYPRKGGSCRGCYLEDRGLSDGRGYKVVGCIDNVIYLCEFHRIFNAIHEHYQGIESNRQISLSTINYIHLCASINFCSSYSESFKVDDEPSF